MRLIAAWLVPARRASERWLIPLRVRASLTNSPTDVVSDVISYAV
jgi:hypothetical protein